MKLEIIQCKNYCCLPPLDSLNSSGLEEQVVFFWLIKKNQFSSDITNSCLALCSGSVEETGETADEVSFRALQSTLQ